MRKASVQRKQPSVEANNTSDIEIIKDRLGAIRSNTGCEDMYVDGGFHSKDVTDAAKANGIEIHLTDMSGTKPVKKIPATNFKIDSTTNIIHRCPENQVPFRVAVNVGQTVEHFPHSACDKCEPREPIQL